MNIGGALPKVLKIFRTPSGRQPFVEWLTSLRDERAAARVKTRLARLRLGNLGTTRSVGCGVQELKIDYGPGYRVYFGQVGSELIVLLCGGDKGNQDEDIKIAKEYWTSCKKEKSYACS